MRSAARGSPLLRPEIGVDDADQIELREMMALGDQLGADDDVEAAGGDVVELFAQPLDGGDEIGGEHEDARLRKQPRTSSSSRSTPGPMAANEFAAWHFGHSAGCGMAKPQWWQTSCRRKR